MPEVIQVTAQDDFWHRLCRTKPLRAISELVWNSFDADANEVIVHVEKNLIDGIERITISDDGSGIARTADKHEFSNLGGSWKAKENRTKGEKRILHGRTGQGRFRAFALGERVTWETRYKNGGDIERYIISGIATEPGKFQLDDAIKIKKGKTGTEVKIENVNEASYQLLSDDFRDDLSRIFAPYLVQYRCISLILNGVKIDTDDLVLRNKELKLGPYRLSNGSEISAELEIIEWTSITGRALYLCDANGFALAERAPDIRAPGYNFGAYLKSSYFGELDEGALIDLDLGEGVTVLVSNARSKLSEYFRAREREKAASLIQKWKEEEIYPYEQEPSSPTEKNAQKIFNMCAFTIHDYVAGFEDQEKSSKALSFRLLREAVEGSPNELAHILSDVLSLPIKKKKELSKLLEKTNLSSIIDTVSEITERLNIAKGLRTLVCAADIRNSVKEREHIHKIVERNPWLFGEEYALGQSESSLTNLLREHLKRLGRDEKVLEPVVRAHGNAGRIDVMLAKTVKRSGRDDDQHLVIELKRANRILKFEDLNQITSYANSVLRDHRFNKTAVSWEFWLVGVELDDDLEEQTNSADRAPGCAHIFKNGRGRIWVVTWGQVIHDCLSRLEFVRDKLNLAVTEEEAIEYLNQIYPEYVPEAAE